MRPVAHPTKEQVRAWMAEREAARRPPPSPEEIRRTLGWRMDLTDDERLLVRICLLPSSYGQLAAQLTLDWLFAPVRAVDRAK